MSIRARAANARYIARHPVQMFRISPTVIGVHNRRSRRTLERGRSPWTSGVSAAISSRTPFYRNRINRATGRKNRDNGYMHRIRNKGLARMRASDRQDAARIIPPATRRAPLRSNPADGQARMAALVSRARSRSTR